MTAAIPDEAWWERARGALARLAEQQLGHPAVALVDIGIDPEGLSALPVLRVHVRPGREPPAIPEEIDGILVRVTEGDYRLEGAG